MKNKATTKELVKKVLEKWKFPILEEADHTVVVRYQMNYAHITSMHDEADSVAVMLTNIFSAKNEDEIRIGMKTCNEINSQLIHIKCFIDTDDDLVVSSEFFGVNEDNVEDYLTRGLQAAIYGKNRFLSRYDEIEEEEKLMQELDKEE